MQEADVEVSLFIAFRNVGVACVIPVVCRTATPAGCLQAVGFQRSICLLLSSVDKFLLWLGRARVDAEAEATSLRDQLLKCREDLEASRSSEDSLNIEVQSLNKRVRQLEKDSKRRVTELEAELKSERAARDKLVRSCS
jgi:uncharacterized protein YlxW (UPF0749 family)